MVKISDFDGYPRRRLLAVAYVLSSVIGCGSFDSSSSTSSGPGFDLGVGGRSSNTATPESITFSPGNTVLLKPGDTGYRTVVVQPDATYDVALALLDGSSDAALSATVVRTSATGQAQFSITASSVAASFGVRASAGQLSAVLPVSVSDSGYASLNVTGNYSGVRQVSEWVATLKNDELCTAFGSTLPNDSAIAAQSVVTPPDIVVSDIPIGPVQSVVLRGDHSVWGCKDVPALTTGTTLDIPVQLFDIPAVYGPDPVPAVFTVRTNADVWASNMASTKTALLNAFEQSTTSDVELLLDAMSSAAQAQSTQSDFDQRRANGNWHSVVATQWATLDGSGDQCIGVVLDKWLSTGVAQIGKGITIDTQLKLISASTSLGQEQLNLKSMAGYPANSYAPVTDFPLTTTFGANDSLAASATLSFNEAHLLRSLTLTSAQQQLPNVADVPGALATYVQCDALAAGLDNASPQSTLCDVSCLSHLCSQALAQLWSNTASAADQRGANKLTLSCSGTLQLDANAVVRGYKGNWIGSISSMSGNVSTGGPIG